MDFNYELFIRAGEIAEEEYGMDFTDLPKGIRDKVFAQAEKEFHDERTYRDYMMSHTTEDIF